MDGSKESLQLHLDVETGLRAPGAWKNGAGQKLFFEQWTEVRVIATAFRRVHIPDQQLGNVLCVATGTQI